jgi:hypothetical protein
MSEFQQRWILVIVRTTTTGNCDVGVAFSGVMTFIVKPLRWQLVSGTHLIKRIWLTVFTVWSDPFVQLPYSVVDNLFQW